MSLVVKEILQIAERRLADSHCASPKVDAELLFCHMLSLDKTQLFLKQSSVLDQDSCEEYFKLVDKRSSGIPAQYIMGNQEFMGLNFIVNESVLIPRPETELLVAEIIKFIRNKREEKTIRSNYNILDLCTGSGAIGLSIAKIIHEVKVTAIDISEEALEVARENCKKLHVQNKVKILQSDLFNGLKTGLFGQKFNMIVSNPPYIKTSHIPILQKEVKEHEPLLALDGGNDGLEFYRRIVDGAPEFLKKKGKLYLEIGYDQALDIMALIAKNEKFGKTEVMKDLSGLDRIIITEMIG